MSWKKVKICRIPSLPDTLASLKALYYLTVFINNYRNFIESLTLTSQISDKSLIKQLVQCYLIEMPIAEFGTFEKLCYTISYR